jgi:diguanylate cyclase (GGDEF)-like protein
MPLSLQLRRGIGGQRRRRDNAEAARFNYRLTLGVTGALLAAEVGVAIMAAPAAGVFLLAGTGALGFLEHRGQRFAAIDRAAAMEAYAREQTEALRTDPGTGLPNRQLLIEQLSREIARVDRYDHRLTLCVTELEQADELANLWGEATREAAVLHVAETLKRIARASDFVARLDARHFATILVQCSGDQGALFAERLGLAVGNRPIQAGRNGRLPLYVQVSSRALAFDAERFRGPLEFLSEAGGDVVPGDAVHVAPRRRGPADRADARELRRRLIRDYYPGGQAEEFATAFRSYLKPNRKAS